MKMKRKDSARRQAGAWAAIAGGIAITRALLRASSRRCSTGDSSTVTSELRTTSFSAAGRVAAS